MKLLELDHNGIVRRYSWYMFYENGFNEECLNVHPQISAFLHHWVDIEL